VDSHRAENGWAARCLDWALRNEIPLSPHTNATQQRSVSNISIALYLRVNTLGFTPSPAFARPSVCRACRLCHTAIIPPRSNACPRSHSHPCTSLVCAVPHILCLHVLSRQQPIRNYRRSYPLSITVTRPHPPIQASLLNESRLILLVVYWPK